MATARVSVSTYNTGSVGVVAAEGELDVLSIPDADGHFAAAAGMEGSLVLDLRGLTYIDSAGLELMVTLHNMKTETNGGFAILVREGSQPDEVMRVVGLHTVTTVTSDPTEAGLES